MSATKEVTKFSDLVVNSKTPNMVKVKHLRSVFPGLGDGTLARPVRLNLGAANFNTGTNLVLGNFRGNGMLGIAAKHLEGHLDDWLDVVTATKRP
jgi:hypothetical protein